jgi:hypothetical protein
MIRDPQNISPADPTYRDPNIDPTADPRYEARKGMDAGTVVGMALGVVMLLVAGAAWIFAPEKTTTAINPPPMTTGQGSTSQTKPASAPATSPAAPSARDTNPSLDNEVSPTMKK